MNDNLHRFLAAHQQTYSAALNEIKTGKKPAIGYGLFFSSCEVLYTWLLHYRSLDKLLKENGYYQPSFYLVQF